jgi:hypothetical protein
MKGQTVRLNSAYQRQLAHHLIERAPAGAVLNVREATRTSDQNAKLWAMLSDVARAKPQGRVLDTDTWKALFMASLGHRVRFEPALDGQGVVAIGFRSSHLTKAAVSDLIEALYAYGAEHGVVWSEPTDERAAA